MNRIGIVAKQGEPRAVEAARDLIAWLESRGLTSVVQPSLAQELGGRRGTTERDFPEACDLVVVLGGDGTLLYAARLVGPFGVPVFPVNLGHLGFLCNAAVEALVPSLELILQGHGRTVERLQLCGQIVRDGERIDGPFWALNDLVVHLASIARTMTLRIAIDGFMAVPSLVADGLIISSPTGSTAYNLSAGGPILTPTLQAMILAPMLPISLSQRPLVVDGSSTVDVELLGGLERAFVTLDGQVRRRLQPDDHLVVARSEYPVKIIHVDGFNFYEVLRQKMGWARKPGEGSS